MNTVFYKYRSDSEFTEQIFSSGQVFLATADGLNDPFECSLQDIGRVWINERVKEMKQAGVAGFRLEARRSLHRHEKFFGLAGSQIEETLESIRGHNSIEESYEFYVDFIRQHTGHPPSDCDRVFSGIDSQLNSVGIFSLSKKCDHPLMWAHYAGEHTGVCLGFERTKDSRLEQSDQFLQVLYSDSLPALEDGGFQVVMSMSVDESGRAHTSSYKIAFTDKTFQRAITTKPTCWSYEEEWRYVEPYSGLYAWPGTLSEITFGMKCPEERRMHYIQLAEQYVPNEVKLFQIRKIHGTNSIERIPLDPHLTSPSRTEHPRNSQKQSDEAMNAQEFAANMERLIRQENYGEALFQINENLKNSPDEPMLLHLKGVAHGFAKQPEKALECFKSLTEMFPDVAQGWYQMSCALVELEMHEEAVGSLKRAFDLDPNDASIAFNYGINLLRVQDTPDEGLFYLKRAEVLGHRRAHQIIADIEEQESKRTNKALDANT